MRTAWLAVLMMPIAVAALPARAGRPAQAGDAPGVADRLVNDPRVTALSPYGLRFPPDPRDDKRVQFGHALRMQIDGGPRPGEDVGRIGVVTPTLKPVKQGDRIVIAFWARAEKTQGGAPGRIGRVQLETTPNVRAIFQQAFEVGPEWKMYNLSGKADADYRPGQLNAALHLAAARQVIDVGPVYILDYGQ